MWEEHRKTLRINGIKILGKWNIDVGTYYYKEYGKLMWHLDIVSELLQVINSDLSHLLIQIIKMLLLKSVSVLWRRDYWA